MLTLAVDVGCTPLCLHLHPSASGKARGEPAREAGVPRDNGDIGSKRCFAGYIILNTAKLCRCEL